MYKEDYKLLDNLKEIRNITWQTRTGYKQTIKKYTKFHKKSLTKLIKEAEREEQQGIEWKHRKIRQRLIDFRNYLINQDYMLKTIQQYMQRIKTIYHTYEIELRPLPHISDKNIRKAKPLKYSDLPDKELLKKIIPMCKPIESAIILFMCSSGCARKETLNLTIQDFIDSVNDYYSCNDIYELLNNLHGREDIIPEWSIYRNKTGKFYTTFSSPESTVYLMGYLLSRRDILSNDNKLFKTNEHYVSDFFSRINKRLDLGKCGTYNRFRSHMLRKFHASNLYGDGMSMDMVNELQGKGKDKTNSAYFIINPRVLKREYLKHIGAVTVLNDGVVGGVWDKLDLSDLEDFSKFY